MPATAQAFDAAAAGYDRQFTHSLIGSRLRRAVWTRCAARFAEGSRLLEMNCGTGEDALHLARAGMHVLATDVSQAMLGVARAKVPAAPLRGSLSFEPLAWEDLERWDGARFDGVLSNFGGLNCVADLRHASRGLAAHVRPGGWALLCVMGRHVPWEWAWYLGHGRPRKAFRRITADGLPWNGIRIRYPTPQAVRAAFGAEFHCVRIGALGALLPPPYSETLWRRMPRLLAALDRCERVLEARWPLPWLADHFLIELQRL